MAVIPYPISRALLFCMDAECAHNLTTQLLSKTQGTLLDALYRQPFIHDPITLAGLRFPNRVGMAAGLDKNAKFIDALGAMGFGFVEAGTVTPLPQAGNPKPRMFRLTKSQALINRLGFNNDGLNAFITNLEHSQFRQQGRILGLNIGKNAATPIAQANQDYLIGLAAVYPHADYVTVNISSPNTQDLRSLQHNEALDHLLQAINAQRHALTQQHSKHVPIFLKIAPDLEKSQVDWIANVLVRHQIDGVIATNTTIDRRAIQNEPSAHETGGLSGKPVLAASNRVIAWLRASLNIAYGAGFPIIGVGGIFSAQDALSKIAAGADAVQIYTGLIYRGPSLVTECARALSHQRHAK